MAFRNGSDLPRSEHPLAFGLWVALLVVNFGLAVLLLTRGQPAAVVCGVVLLVMLLKDIPRTIRDWLT